MTNIIKKNEEFQKIFEKGHSIYGRYLVVYFLHNSLNFYRVGFCVGRKLGNAVNRNRIKRLLREATRATEVSLWEGWDILLVARNPTRGAKLIELIEEIKNILMKASRTKSLKITDQGTKEDSQ